MVDDDDDDATWFGDDDRFPCGCCRCCGCDCREMGRSDYYADDDEEEDTAGSLRSDSAS